MDIKSLLNEIKACRYCEKHLPLGPNPVVSFSESSAIMIIGQAPGTKVHASGIPWDDASGNRLREWMGIGKADFYDQAKIAIVPMGFCYPGKGKSGDLPPRPECAPLWHDRIRAHLKEIKLTLLIGQYAQAAYLQESRKRTLTETVKAFREYLPEFLPLPHPSPRNNIWMRKNDWFRELVLPELREKINGLLK